MAIGTAAAIGLGVAGIGSALGGASSSKAAGKAADTSLAVAEKNNALQREIYGQNQTALQPYMQRGNVAGDYLNAFLGLPSAVRAQAAPAAAPAATAQPVAATGSPNYGTIDPQLARMFPNAFAGKILNGTYPDGTVVGANGAQAAPTAQAPAAGMVTTPAVSQADAQNAFGSYIGNSDYGFQFATGSNAVNSGYAGNGSLQSGAAMKALEQYRQNLQAGYRNEYTGLLANQQGVGLSGASALAGVGQNYAASVGANNTAAGNAAANAALIKGQNNPFANALSTLGGGLLGLGG